MKKLFLTIAVAMGVFSSAIAQNNMWVGGTAGIWSSKVKGGDSQLSFKVMPEFGYILSSNLGVGIAIGGAHTHGTTEFDGNIVALTESTNSYIVNPFLRYTFLKSDLGGLFFDGGVAYAWSKGTAGGEKISGLEVGLRPGLAINISNTIALLGKFGFLGYQTAKIGEGNDGQKADSFGFDFDMSNVEFGINYKF